jgi:hypothetical protein
MPVRGLFTVVISSSVHDFLAARETNQQQRIQCQGQTAYVTARCTSPANAYGYRSSVSLVAKAAAS